MSILECIRMALGALASNKMRSVLTMLGVIIGVAAVIALVSLGQGAQQQITTRMTLLGTNQITVSVQGYARFVDDDIEALLKRVPSLAYATPIIQQPVTAKAGNLTYDSQIQGVSHQFPEIRDYSLDLGRWFDEEEVIQRRRVAVIGYTVFTQLFQERGAIGEMINLRGQLFQIIGVAAPKGASMGSDPDDRVWVPYSTAMRLLGTRWIPTLMFKAQSAEVASQAAGHLTRILEEKFRNVNRNLERRMGRKVEPFRVFSQDELLNTVSEMTQTFTILLAGIAAVSLLVGGIGIMNIMLVSVTERTREIGIRKAIGARRADVLMQFLVESVAISATGGVIGIVFGSWLAQFLARFNQMSVTVSMTSVIVSFTFASIVGVFFGLWPAVKASRLDPIVALRYE